MATRAQLKNVPLDTAQLETAIGALLYLMQALNVDEPMDREALRRELLDRGGHISSAAIMALVIKLRGS